MFFSFSVSIYPDRIYYVISIGDLFYSILFCFITLYNMIGILMVQLKFIVQTFMLIHYYVIRMISLCNVHFMSQIFPLYASLYRFHMLHNEAIHSKYLISCILVMIGNVWDHYFHIHLYLVIGCICLNNNSISCINQSVLLLWTFYFLIILLFDTRWIFSIL